jgi:hypothetical protein
VSTPAGSATKDFDSIKSNIENKAKNSGLDQSDAYWYILSELERLEKMVREKDAVIAYLESKILKLEL